MSIVFCMASMTDVLNRKTWFIFRLHVTYIHCNRVCSHRGSQLYFHITRYVLKRRREDTFWGAKSENRVSDVCHRCHTKHNGHLILIDNFHNLYLSLITFLYNLLTDDKMVRTVRIHKSKDRQRARITKARI
jgi:hypothetical protein